MPLKRQSTDIEMTESSPVSLKRSRSSDNTHTKKAKLLNTIVKAPSIVGKVFVFGTGDTGQLGLGDEMLERKKPMPLKVLDDKEVTDIICGGMHSIALTKEGKLWSWGCNDQRALGRSGEEYEPAPVENMEDVKIVKVACCDSVTMALSDKGQLYCWGTYRSAEGHLGFSREKAVQEVPALFEPFAKIPIADISAGTDHCLALTQDGRVYVWGNGQQFQLGRRIMERHLINGLRPEMLNLKNIKLIGTGSYHSFAVAEDNTIYTWGLNNFQQCGLADPESNEGAPNVITKPTVITSLQNKGGIKSVQAGEHHSLVLMEDGHVYAFGRADSDQLGLPAEVINTLQTHEEGAESSFKRAVGVPTLIPGFENIESIAVGTNHNIALSKEGKAYTWGFGECYALGNGSSDDESAPTELTGQKLEGHKVIRISAGAQHSMVLATL